VDIFLVEGSWFRRGNNGPGKKDIMSGQEDLRTSSDWQAQLYNRYHQKVFGICLYFLKDREEAKDASHDVFIKAFRAWKDFEWKCDPLTWIGAIAKHDCFSRRQRVKKQGDRRAQLAVEEETLQNCEPDEDLVLHRMRLEKIMPDVRGKLREILRLSLEQGLNHREIALQMGVSRVAITRRLTRFKKELQDVGQSRELSFNRAQARPKSAIRSKTFRPALSGFPAPENTGMESELRLIAA
jgi:RNA polymerase sigma-70 factor, ECF subfamily